MYVLKFRVVGQCITRTDEERPVAKCKNLFKAQFDFTGEEWNGTKTAVFSSGNAAVSQILNDKNECVVPWEFFDAEYDSVGKVSVFCGDLVTANAANVHIEKSGYVDSDASAPPTPGVYQQLIDTSNETKKIAQSVRDDADNGKFKGDQGPRGEMGPRGEAGPQGPIGPKGEVGLKGEKGDTGAQGLKGDRGETGSEGASAYQIAVKLGYTLINKIQTIRDFIFFQPKICLLVQGKTM